MILPIAHLGAGFNVCRQCNKVTGDISPCSCERLKRAKERKVRERVIVNDE